MGRSITELLNFSNNGSYSIVVKRISDNTNILGYNNLRDENVLFNDFSIEEIDQLSVSDFETSTEDVEIIQNPVKDFISLINLKQPKKVLKFIVE
jgi:hypothetical protein